MSAYIQGVATMAFGQPPDHDSIGLRIVAACDDGLCITVTHLYATVDGGKPAVLALIQLDEGPIAMGRASPQLRTDGRVHVQFRPFGANRSSVPYFARRD